MPYIDTLSDAEILALTDEQVGKIIKLKLAEGGIKIISKPEEPEYHNIPEGNEVLFQVTGVSALFSDRTVASQIAEKLKENRSCLKETSYSHDYNYKFQKDFNLDYYGKPEPISIMEVRVFSKDLLTSIKEDVKSNEQIKKSYEERKKEYESVNSQAENIKEEVWSRVYEIRQKQAEKESSYARFLEYLALTESDKNKAMVFYKKAYNPDEQTIQFIESKMLEQEIK